jgi:hypothetical protein
MADKTVRRGGSLDGPAMTADSYILRRIGLKIGFLLICGLIQWPAVHALGLIYLFGISAVVSFVMALHNRSSVRSRRLNYWDDAIVFTALTAALYFFIYDDANVRLAHPAGIHGNRSSVREISGSGASQ